VLAVASPAAGVLATAVEAVLAVAFLAAAVPDGTKGKQ
jgi:hypothetical protein